MKLDCGQLSRGEVPSTSSSPAPYTVHLSGSGCPGIVCTSHGLPSMPSPLRCNSKFIEVGIVTVQRRLQGLPTIPELDCDQ